MSKPVRILLVIIVLALIAWYFWPRDTGPEPITASMVISAHASGVPTECQIQTRDGKDVVYVIPGDSVEFINTWDSPVTITFDENRVLFDTNEVTLQPGESTSLEVRKDAEAAGSASPHRFKSCDPDVGPPGIIVCPPGKRDC